MLFRKWTSGNCFSLRPATVGSPSGAGISPDFNTDLFIHVVKLYIVANRKVD